MDTVSKPARRCPNSGDAGNTGDDGDGSSGGDGVGGEWMLQGKLEGLSRG